MAPRKPLQESRTGCNLSFLTFVITMIRMDYRQLRQFPADRILKANAGPRPGDTKGSGSMSKKKAYEAHEVLYQRMKAGGLRSWEKLNAQNEHHNGLEVYMEQFMADALSQPWAPGKGKAIEIGCGTGPIVRWLAKRGFVCLGIDISGTAVAMAREQSKGLDDVRFEQADICDMNPSKLGAFALVVDGHCLHCITQPKDRKAFLHNAHRLLQPGGLFLVATMCRPIDRRAFSMKHREKLIGSTVYASWARAGEFTHSRTIKGKAYMPTRHIGHWKDILTEIKTAGFRPQLVRLNLHYTDHPISSLCVGAIG